MKQFLSSVIVLFAVLLLSPSAFANSPELMDFYGLQNMQQVGNFYDGGSSLNFGVTFSSNFYGLVAAQAGNFLTPPLGGPAVFMIGNPGSTVTGTINVTNGFSGGLNFEFTAGFGAGQFETVKVWSGANGTGTVLATIFLANNNGYCSSSGPLNCNWSFAGVNLCPGGVCQTAQSITFTGPADELGLADITIGSATVPESSSVYLLGIGLVGLSLGSIRRFLSL